MTPLRRESLKKHENADTAKWAVAASREVVFVIVCLTRRVGLTRSGIGREQLSGALVKATGKSFYDHICQRFVIEGGLIWCFRNPLLVSGPQLLLAKAFLPDLDPNWN